MFETDTSVPPPEIVPPAPPPRDRRHLSVATAVLITLVVALVLGGVLFAAGWQFGKGATSAAVGSSQSAQATVSALTTNNLQTVQEAIVAKVRPAVVQVDVLTKDGGAIGSGVIIDQRGYIITNHHVIDGAQQIGVMLFDGTSLPAQLVGSDTADDLALLQVALPTGITVMKLGDSSKVQVGQYVLAIGNPLGITQTVTSGIVSALNRTLDEPGVAVLPDAIQTDAAINPGNSGGALVDLQGNLIGIPTLTAIDPEFNTPANGVGFAVPANRVNFIVPQLIQYGKVQHTGRAALNVKMTSVDDTIAAKNKLPIDEGVLIVSVNAGGAAEKAGVKAGDVIVQAENTPVYDVLSLGDVLVTKDPGNTVALGILRGNQQLILKVTLGELQTS